jgi:hypothetical protein
MDDHRPWRMSPFAVAQGPVAVQLDAPGMGFFTDLDTLNGGSDRGLPFREL